MRTAGAFGSGAVALKKCYYGKLILFCSARIVLCFSPDLVYNGPTLSTVYVVFFALPVARLRLHFAFHNLRGCRHQKRKWLKRSIESENFASTHFSNRITRITRGIVSALKSRTFEGFHLDLHASSV